jgi:hypothetical protein
VAEARQEACSETDLVADELESRGAEGARHLGSDLEQGGPDDLQRGTARDAAAAYELDGNPAPVELGADLWPRAVHDDDLVAVVMELERVLRGDRGDRAAELHDDAH